MDLKPGYRTSEFWFAVVAAIAGFVIAVPDHSPWWRVLAGVTLAIIPVVVHSANRTELKSHALEIAHDVRAPTAFATPGGE